MKKQRKNEGKGSEGEEIKAITYKEENRSFGEKHTKKERGRGKERYAGGRGEES